MKPPPRRPLTTVSVNDPIWLQDEFINEGVNYFDEIRWRTWKTSVFTNNGLQSVWGQRNTTYTWGGDHFYVWPIPQSEIQINNKLTQNPGWPN